MNGTCHVVALQLNAGPRSVLMHFAPQETYMRANPERASSMAEAFIPGPTGCASRFLWDCTLVLSMWTHACTLPYRKQV